MNQDVRVLMRAVFATLRGSGIVGDGCSIAAVRSVDATLAIHADADDHAAPLDAEVAEIMDAVERGESHGHLRRGAQNPSRSGRAEGCYWIAQPIVSTNGSVVGALGIVSEVRKPLGDTARSVLSAQSTILGLSLAAQGAIDTAPFDWALESTLDIFVQTDRRGRILGISPSIERYSGYTPSELFGVSVARLYRDAGEWRDIAIGLARQGVVSNRLISMVTKTGRIVKTSVNAEVVRDVTGRVIGHRSSLRDVSALEQVMAEKELALEQLSLVLKNIPVILFAVDLEARFTMFQGAGLSRIGRQPGAFLGKKVSEVVSNSPEFQDALARALAGENVDLVSDFQGLSFDSRFRPMLRADGSVRGAIGVAIDISETTHLAMDLLAQHAFGERLLNNMGQGVAIVDQTGVVRLTNGAFDAMVGWRSTTEREMTVPLLNDEDERRFLDLRHRALAGEATSEEFSLARVEGGPPLPVLVHASRTAEGMQPQGTMLLFTDLTSAKSSEAAIANERDFALQIMNGMGHGLVVADADGRIIFANMAIAWITGRSRESLIGTRTTDHLTPESVAEVAIQREARQSGSTTTYELEILRPDGAVVPVQIVGAPYMRDGVFAGSFISVTDLTQIRESARLLANSERTHRELNQTTSAVFSSMADGLLVVDARGNIDFSNRQAWTLLGIDSSDRRNKPQNLADLRLDASEVSVDPARSVLGDIIEQIIHARPIIEAEFAWPDRRSVQIQRFTIEGSGRDSGEARHGYLIRDVTQEKDIEAVKDELISVVSHELRTPLTSLVGFVELLRDDPTNPDNGAYLEIMDGEAQRLTELLDEFLDLQRLEQGRASLARETCDMAEIFRRAIDAAGEDRARPISLRIDSPLSPVLGDRRRLIQVVTNLLSNARKYSPDGGEIVVIARTDANSVFVSIEDHGLGVPRDQIPRLFARFFRVERFEQSEIPGSGLGLSICKNIIEWHGGEIAIESDGPGQGTTVSFSLPLGRDP